MVPKREDYVDQLKIFDPKTWGWPVHLIGAGGINNLVGATLAKMGISEIHIWDDDILESRNLPTEVGYSAAMCGKPKVEAMAGLLSYLMPENSFKLHLHQERVTEQTPLNGVIIAGVDSMASRKIIWENVKNNYIEIPFFIDGRSGGEETQLFAFSPADFNAREDYETWLFDDSEAARLTCGARNIGYISAYFAGEISYLLTLFHRGLPIPEFPIIRNFAANQEED